MHATGFLLAIGVALVGAPIATSAQTIYQCTADGHVAYQDTPCKGHGVRSRKLSLDASPTGTRAVPTPTAASPKPDTAMQQTLRSIASQQRVLYARIRAEEAFMRAEMDAARHRAEGQSPDAQRKAMMQAHDKWWPGIQAKKAQVKQLTDAVHRLCPGGARLDAEHAVCLQD
jgi:hypothetical protein